VISRRRAADLDVPARLSEDYQNDPPPADGASVLNDTDTCGVTAEPQVGLEILPARHNPSLWILWPLYIESDPAITGWISWAAIKDQRDYPMGTDPPGVGRCGAATPRSDWRGWRRTRAGFLALLPANPGQEYLVTCPTKSLTLTVRTDGQFAVEWFLRR